MTDDQIEINRLKGVIDDLEHDLLAEQKVSKGQEEEKDHYIRELAGVTERLEACAEACDELRERAATFDIEQLNNRWKWELLREHWEDISLEDLRGIVKATLRV